MLTQHKGSLFHAERQDKEARMPQKFAITALVVICITLLVFTWITRK